MKKTINKTLRNYVILIVLFLIVIFTYLTFIKIYRVNKVAKSSILINTVSVISIKDFDNYIIENPNGLIYMPSLEKNNNDFEKDLLSLIIDNRLEDKVVYLNIGNSNYKKMKEKLQIDNNYLTDETAIVILFKDATIIDTLVITENYNLNSIREIIEKGNEVLDND